MNSSFDVNAQNDHIESKITIALERLSEAFRVLLWKQSKEHGLSPIQIQILIFVAYHQSEFCKVSYLAEEFNMTKATISDSVKVLLKKGIIDKQSDPQDTRSYTIHLTAKGREISKHAASFAHELEQAIINLDASEKEMMYTSLTQIINHLVNQNTITVNRMCMSCLHFQKKGTKMYCHFLNKDLIHSTLRLDCPEHEPIKDK